MYTSKLIQEQTMAAGEVMPGSSRFNVFHKTLAIGNVVLAFMSSGTAQAQQTRESAHAASPSIFNLYTDASPADVIGPLQEDLAPGRNLIISSGILTPSTFIAKGACEQGSLYSDWNDTPASLRTAKCDGTSETEAHSPDPSLQTRFTPELAKAGSFMINSIPGHSLDLKQKSVNLTTPTPGSVKESFKCPNPNSNKAATSIGSIVTSSNNVGGLAYCHSTKADIIESPVNINKAPYKKAFKKFKADSLRGNNSRKWQGDILYTDLYVACPEYPNGQDPRLAFKYHAESQSVTIAYDPMGYSPYCDKVGQNREDIRIEVRKNSSQLFKQAGKDKVHIDGLKDILRSQYTNIRNEREWTKIRGVGQLCAKGSSVQMRVKITDKFTPYRAQTFQTVPNQPDRPTNMMRSGRHTYKSAAKNICN